MPQGVQLTEQGRTLLQQAEKWLGDESAVRAAMRVSPAGTVAPLRLGIMECLVPFCAQVSMPAMVRRSRSPSAIRPASSTCLRSNQLDAAMAFNVPGLPELRVHAERDDDLGLVYAPDMAPAGVPPFRLEQCLDHPLCLPDAALSVWPRLNAEIYRARADPRIVLWSNSIALILDFVAAGRGVSFLNWLDVALGVERGELRFAHLVSRRLSDRLCLVTATNAPPRPETLKLLTNLYEQCRPRRRKSGDRIETSAADRRMRASGRLRPGPRAARSLHVLAPHRLKPHPHLAPHREQPVSRHRVLRPLQVLQHQRHVPPQPVEFAEIGGVVHHPVADHHLVEMQRRLVVSDLAWQETMCGPSRARTPGRLPFVLALGGSRVPAVRNRGSPGGQARTDLSPDKSRRPTGSGASYWQVPNRSAFAATLSMS